MKRFSSYVAVGAFLTSCIGNVTERPEQASGEGASGGAAANPGDDAAGQVLPLRLLSRVEYNHTVHDLLGDESSLANAFPSESAAETGFAKVSTVDDVNLVAYRDAAESLAAQAVQDIKALMGCEPANLDAVGEATCVKNFVERFGGRVYRRPLGDGELKAHLDFYHQRLRQELALQANEAVETLIAGMLQSPFFLYRWENAWLVDAKPDGSQVPLSSYHMASQLSYFLWSTMPDDELFAAAKNDALRTSAQIEAQARRMLQSPKASRTISNFAEQWLGVVALPGALRNKVAFPQWNAELGRAMVQEVGLFFANVVLAQDGRMRSLFASPDSFANEALAQIYGLSDAKGAQFVPFRHDPQRRAGVLTLAGVMAAAADENEPSPILRGKFVREHLMCDEIPPPPGGVPDLPDPEAGQSKRQRFAQHSQGSCAGCHELMDPIGFGFEHYDAIGAYRTKDGQLEIDASGNVTGLDGQDLEFANAIELSSALGQSPQVADCLARQWFRFAFSRKEAGRDEATIQSLNKVFAATDYNIRELLVAVATSPAFALRQLAVGEVVRP